MGPAGIRLRMGMAVMLTVVLSGARPVHAGTPTAGPRLPAPVQAAGVPGRWIVTWASAPAAAVPHVTAGYPGRTIRNVVHTTAAGSGVRVHLSNRFGTAPVLMGQVTIAVSARAGGRSRDGVIDASDGSARPGTMRTLLFGGRPSVTVPAGAQVVSDPVLLDVPADHDVLVTTWTPARSGTVTYHPASRQWSFYNDDGVNHAADEAAAAVPKKTAGWHYVSGVDVLGGDATVVVLGDSITDGTHSTWGANRRWTDYLAVRLAAAGGARVGVANVGVSGNRVLLDGGAATYTIFHEAGRSALARLSYDVLDRPGVRTVVVLQGINDIQQVPQQTDPQQLIAGLGQVVVQARARGLRVVGCTVLPWEGWYAYTPELERVRQAVNAWIRTGGAFDAVVDLDAATADPLNPRRLRPEYDSGDHLHPNDAGNRAMADAVPLTAL